MNKIFLDILSYNDIRKKKGKYYPKLNNHILHNNPACEIVEHYAGSDYCFVSYEQERVIFSFAPSDDIKDWVNDFKSGNKNELNENGVHKGFNKSFEQFKQFITNNLNTVGTRDIFFTGHSRGGALAQLGAMLSGELGKPTHCITSGSPRVFNKKMRDHFALLPIYCTNIINVHDVVPMLPPKVMGYYRTRSWKVLKPKWWYFFPFSFIKIHLDYLSNLRRLEKRDE